MRGVAALLLLSHILMCRHHTDASNQTEPYENFTTTSTKPTTITASTAVDYTTTATWTTLETTAFVNVTRVPQFVKFGNQTVDVNRSFKVPPLEEAKRNDVDLKNTTSEAPNTTASDVVRNHSETTTVRVDVGSTKQSVISGASGKSGVGRSWQGSKHDHEGRYGPKFEDAESGDNTTVVVQAGDTALLDCKVSLLRDKTVSWVRRSDSEAPRLLTVGAQTYSGDPRFSVQFRYPGNWRLQVASTTSSDEGLYECQLSTHPPRVISVFLQVNTLLVAIVDESGQPLREQYYEAGSTLSLRCEVRGVRVARVQWLRAGRPLARARGGVGVRTEALRGGAPSPGAPASPTSPASPGAPDSGARSLLKVARLAHADAGNYTCALPGGGRHSDTVLVHVLNESLAELQQGRCNEGPRSLHILLVAGISIVMLFALDDPS